MREEDIVYEKDKYWVCKEEFGSGRLKIKSRGYAVYENGTTHSKKVASVGYEGEKGLSLAVLEIERRINKTRKG